MHHQAQPMMYPQVVHQNGQIFYMVPAQDAGGMPGYAAPQFFMAPGGPGTGMAPGMMVPVASSPQMQVPSFHAANQGPLPMQMAVSPYFAAAGPGGSGFDRGPRGGHDHGRRRHQGPRRERFPANAYAAWVSPSPVPVASYVAAPPASLDNLPRLISPSSTSSTSSMSSTSSTSSPSSPVMTALSDPLPVLPDTPPPSAAAWRGLVSRLSCDAAGSRAVQVLDL